MSSDDGSKKASWQNIEKKDPPSNDEEFASQLNEYTDAKSSFEAKYGRAKESDTVNAGESKTSTQGGAGEKATIAHHLANPGPVVAEELPEPASREELRKRMEEINK